MKNIKYEILLKEQLLTRLETIAKLEGESVHSTIIKALVSYILRYKFIDENNLHDDMFYGPVLRKRGQEIENEIRSLDV